MLSLLSIEKIKGEGRVVKEIKVLNHGLIILR